MRRRRELGGGKPCDDALSLAELRKTRTMPVSVLSDRQKNRGVTHLEVLEEERVVLNRERVEHVKAGLDAPYEGSATSHTAQPRSEQR